ncbi:MAG: hypothetical protein QXR42_08995 [Candidatus Bathyarchaeia archaeon]
MSDMYIWPVLKEWGKKVFFEINSHYDYAYSIPRRPKKGDILVFYSNKELIGSIPVDYDSKIVTEEERDPDWVKEWKYIVGLNGSKKIEFRFPVRVEDIADKISVLKGKTNLHNTCRVAPKIKMNEYNLILKTANKLHK